MSLSVFFVSGIAGCVILHACFDQSTKTGISGIQNLPTSMAKLFVNWHIIVNWYSMCL